MYCLMTTVNETEQIAGDFSFPLLITEVNNFQSLDCLSHQSSLIIVDDIAEVFYHKTLRNGPNWGSNLLSVSVESSVVTTTLNHLVNSYGGKYTNEVKLSM